jgi:hypothetical protein
MKTTIYWNTVAGQLREVLKELMAEPLLAPFRLVGGTCLSLQIGHRVSVDIDLFTDAAYNTIDFHNLDHYLRRKYPYVSKPTPGPVGMGRSYFLGNSEYDAVKLDLYYTDSFIRDIVAFDSIRMASIEEIIAMKLDVIQRTGRKKDFWDLHSLLDKYSITQMLDLHRERYSFNHDAFTILNNLTDFSLADDDPDPVCLQGKHWEFIRLEIAEAIKEHR